MQQIQNALQQCHDALITSDRATQGHRERGELPRAVRAALHPRHQERAAQQDALRSAAPRPGRGPAIDDIIWLDIGNSLRHISAEPLCSSSRTCSAAPVRGQDRPDVLHRRADGRHLLRRA